MGNDTLKSQGENKNRITTQARLILIGLFISTVVIFCVAGFVITGINKNINSVYESFSQMLSKTLAIEGVELTKGETTLAKYNTLKTNTSSIIKSNDDIAYIIFKDKDSNIIYSSKEDYPEQAEKTRITVSSPMVVKNSTGSVNVGNVEVGLSGVIIDNISGVTKFSILMVFLLAWFAIAGIVWINSSVITAELRKLCQGVKKISSGEFGYVIDKHNTNNELKELYTAFNDMSERLSRYNEQTIESLILEKDKMEAVLMSIVNGVVVCDNQDNVIMVNNHAKKLLEVSEEDILGSQIQQFCDSAGELCFKEKIAEFKDTPLEDDGLPLPFNIKIDKRIIKCLISPMFTTSNAYVGYIIVLIDVTKDVEMDELRSHFISNVSHELRTPVTVLRSYIDTLYNFGNDFDFNTQREFIGIINQEIIRLNRMVNDILDFSRYESDNIKLEKTKQNIMEIIEDGVNQVQILSKEHNLTISVKKEQDLPEIYLNVDSISRAFMNILSNAIKYSPDGKSIDINVGYSKDNEYVEIRVKDQGPGIPEQYQKKIFDRFFRVENSAHTVKGTGLGLHLVQVTVEKHHHGQVFVESKEGEGSTFGFRLPINISIEEIEEYTSKDLPAESEV